MIENQGRRRWLRASAFVLVFVTFIILLTPVGAEDYQGGWQAQLEAMPRSLTFTFSMPAYKIRTDDEGNASFEMEGFYATGLPGDPELPAALYSIALPPLVPLESVTLQIDTAEQVELPGFYQIAPMGPSLPVTDGVPPGADWGPNAAFIVDGKNSKIYDKDAFYRDEPIELAGAAHMRKWRIAELQYWPVSYNPVSGRIQLTTKATVTLRYADPEVRQDSLTELQDTLMDDRAEQAFLNFSEAKIWYESAMPAEPRAETIQPGYAIITTQEIAAKSTALDDFVSHKEALGYNVQVVTESQYGGLTGQPPNKRADKVRAWLGDHLMSDDLLYVLLIGNPDPYNPYDSADVVGDMPMKIMNDVPGNSNYVPPVPNVPTDFYFADLYSTDPVNWDWWADVYVGRIPVYRSDENWVSILDSILLKTINYEKSGDTAWRRSALLPMAFLDAGVDGGKLGEWMKTDYLDDAGYSTHRLYWHGTLSYSQYHTEEELVDGAVHDRWQSQPFGIVVMYAHGNPRSMGIYEEAAGSGLGVVLESKETPDLDDSRPAFVFNSSCSTGSPEAADNLGYALLKNGAVATISGSRTTYGWPTRLPGPDSHNVSITYNYMKYIVENEPAGKALYWVKNNPDPEPINALAYNLYGDPSIQLGLTAASGAVHKDREEQETAGKTTSLQPVNASKTLTSSSPSFTRETEIGVDGAVTEEARSLDSFAESISGKILSNEPDGIVSMGQIHNCAVKPNGDVECLGDRWGNTDAWDQAADQTGPYSQISAGLIHTCGLKADGSVHCWGKGDYDLGLDHPGPYTQISTTDQHVCALKVDGDIECWGKNDAGQASGQAGPFLQVSTGTNYNCGLKADGSVVCWGGDNDWGEVEDQAGPFKQIASGGNHNCAIKPNGTLFCWGSNKYGQTNYPTGSFVQISAGLDHTCGLTRAGAVKCWGKNEFGQVENREGPYTQVTAGRYHSCALDAYGYAECWGKNESGQAESWHGPFTQVKGGVDHTCGLTAEGTVECWGKNDYGQADGQGLTDKYKLVSSALYHTCGLKADGSVHCWGRQDFDLDIDQPGPFTQISTNYLHVCGLQAGGNIACWGNNDAGQAESPSGSFVQVTTGMQHSCGLADAGYVECWGRNTFGQANDRSGPFVQIDSGFFHTCGLKPDGSVDCWGDNHHGQSVDQAGPFIQISTGWLNTCGLKADGSVQCWGENEYGQSNNQPGPYVRVSTNQFQTVGLKADGTLDFWGGWMTAAEQPGPYGPYRPEAKRMDFVAQRYADGNHYTAVYLADMDGDGGMEVLTGNRDTDALEIWRYDDGLGELIMIDSVEFYQDVHDIKAADFDGDGDMDVVVGLRNMGLHYLDNTGQAGTVGSWDIRLIDSAYSWQVLVADFDKDEKLDIFHGADFGPMQTFYGDGKGNFEAGNPVQDAETEMRFASGFNGVDVNEDGLLDLMGTDGSYMRAFLNPGDRDSDWTPVGQYEPVGTYPCCEPTALQANLSPSAGDLDGNGVADQVAFLGTPGWAGPLEVILFRGEISDYDKIPYWQTEVLDTILYPGYAGHAGVADLDGDGKLDIHVGGWNRFNDLRLYFGNGKGGFTQETVVLEHGVGEFNSLAVGDLNGDQVMDLVTNLYEIDGGEASGFEVLYGSRLPSEWYLPLALADFSQ